MVIPRIASNLKSEACVADMAVTKALRLQQIVSGIFKTDEGEVRSIENHRPKVLAEILADIPIKEKVIVWCVFKDSYSDIVKICLDNEYGFAMLTGLQSQKEKEQAVEDFNTLEYTRIMIANPQAGGVGINLTASSYSVYYSRNFSLEADLQSEARNHRGGQTKKVTRIDMVASDTIDEHILMALKNKQKMSDAILGLRGKL